MGTRDTVIPLPCLLAGKESPAVRMLWGACILFLLLFIVYPLARVFAEADGESWRRVLSSSRWIEAGGHTLLLILLSSSLSVLTGFIYAYGVIRGGLPCTRLFSFIPVLHLVTPPFVGGLSFMLLFGRQGFFTKTLFGLDISLYGLPGLLIAQTLCFFPLAFLIFKETFEGINPSLEFAACNAGAGRLAVFRTVTLPLSLPGIVQAALFIAISVMSDFGNPMLIGGRFSVLAVELYAQLTGWAERGASAALGIILLCPALTLFLVQRLLLRKKGAHTATISGRASSMPPPLPSLPVRVFLFLFCAFISFIVLAQFLAVAGGAFSRIWGIDARFTLDHFFASFSYRTELFNTLSLAFFAAAGTALISAVSAFLVLRTELPFRGIADSLVTLPAAIPGSLVGLAYVLAFNQGMLHLTGTRLVIILVMVISYLPAGFRIISSSLLRIRTSLDDSARSLGASRLRLFADILCPIISKGIASAFVFTFVQASGTLSAVIFLASFKTKLTSIVILNLAGQGDWGRAAALAFILTAVTFFVLGLLRLIVGRQFFFTELS
ncbi:MAG: iron ABC transporter permease [Treponema sp.]|jgi:iron(III) transport system permease protein|nr:iron ABC transporter permease [Treponema sp.]